MPTAVLDAPTRLQRLVPLRWMVLLQGVALWVPVEKLFMTEIGFEAATIGVMAAAYAGLVPVAEVLSGVLADRWSRRGRDLDAADLLRHAAVRDRVADRALPVPRTAPARGG
jgi:MFS family permease